MRNNNTDPHVEDVGRLLDDIQTAIEQIRQNPEFTAGIRGNEMRGTGQEPGSEADETRSEGGSMDSARHSSRGLDCGGSGKNRPVDIDDSHRYRSGPLDILSDRWVLTLFSLAIAVFAFRVALALQA